MPRFGTRSMIALGSCHQDLIWLFETVIEHVDCAVLRGHRTEEDQDKAYAAGRSTLRWPHSKHNVLPSMAVDVIPYPVDWGDIERFREFGGFVLGVASQLGLNITWGGHWKTLIDMPHYQLETKESA